MQRFSFLACLVGLVIFVSSSAHAESIDCAQSKVSIAGMKQCSKGPDNQGAASGCHTESYTAAYGWGTAQPSASAFAYIVDRNYNSTRFASVFRDDQLVDILKSLVNNVGKVEGKNFSSLQFIGGARGMRVDWPVKKCFVFHMNGPSVMGPSGGTGFANYVRGFICGPANAALSDDEIVKVLSSIQVKQ